MLFRYALVCCALSSLDAAAQVTWVNTNPATTPSYRKYTTMVWDSVRERVMLFAGQGDLETYYNDTWEWDGVRWTELSPARRPPEREDHMMAFDRQRGRAVVFGGHDVNVRFFDDTWEWDGTTWHSLTPAVKPPPLAYSAMAYDPLRGRVVMYGGLNQQLNETGDIWEWDGTTWRTRFPGVTPGARSHHAMAWDPVSQRVVLYGGFVTNQGWRNDHWAWDGVRWTLVTTGPGVMDMRLVFDTVRNRLVMWGGRLQPGNQSWEFVSGAWVARTATAPFPLNRQAHTMAFDERNGNTVMFGGYDDVNRFGETWLYEATVTASSSSFGHNCGGTVADPTLSIDGNQRPWLGDTLTLRTTSVPLAQPAVLSVGVSRAVWHSMALPFDLSPAGMPGCELLTGPDILLPMATVGTSASLALALGTQPTWSGQSFYVQAVVGGFGVSGAGLALTNGLHLRVGAR